MRLAKTIHEIKIFLAMMPKHGVPIHWILWPTPMTVNANKS